MQHHFPHCGLPVEVVVQVKVPLLLYIHNQVILAALVEVAAVVVVVVLVDATGRLEGCCGASAAMAGTSPRMAMRGSVRVEVRVRMR